MRIYLDLCKSEGFNWMKNKELITSGFKVSYSVTGRGEKALIAFHGYDQNTSAFDFLFSQSLHKFKKGKLNSC